MAAAQMYAAAHLSPEQGNERPGCCAGQGHEPWLLALAGWGMQHSNQEILVTGSAKKGPSYPSALSVRWTLVGMMWHAWQNLHRLLGNPGGCEVGPASCFTGRKLNSHLSHARLISSSNKIWIHKQLFGFGVFGMFVLLLFKWKIFLINSW